MKLTLSFQLFLCKWPDRIDKAAKVATARDSVLPLGAILTLGSRGDISTLPYLRKLLYKLFPLTVVNESRRLQ